MSEVGNREMDAPSNGYKWVQLGPKKYEIPEEWNVNKLEELTSNSGEYGANASAVPFSEDKPRYIRITDISEEGLLKNEDLQSLDPEDANGYTLSDQQLLFARTGATVGKSLLYDREYHPEAAFAGYLIRFSPDESVVVPEFLFYFTQSKIYDDWVERNTRQGAQENLNASEYCRLPIVTPSFSEQRRIAAVLSKVDEEIRQTEELSKMTEELRIGLRQQHFHQGYFNHDTVTEGTFGEVPEDWDIDRLDDVADVTMGSSPKSEYYNDDGEGLPFFQANNEFGYRSPTHDRWCSNPEKIAEEGDVLVTIRGTYVGQVNMATEKCCIGRGLAAVSAGEVDHEYLFHQLDQREAYVKSIASGSTFDSINSSELRSLLIQVPPRNEQEKIAQTLKLAQMKYIEERRKKQNLLELKRGLMQDLLTGKIRTPPDLLE